MSKELTKTSTQQKLTQVHLALAQIPFGQVISYGNLAKLAGLGQGARFVAYTLRQLPKDTNLPWHRVVNSQGKISIPPDKPSHKRQIERLKDEGILVEAGKVHSSYFYLND